jgi:hypothetical protein
MRSPVSKFLGEFDQGVPQLSTGGDEAHGGAEAFIPLDRRLAGSAVEKRLDRPPGNIPSRTRHASG